MDAADRTGCGLTHERRLVSRAGSALSLAMRQAEPAAQAELILQPRGSLVVERELFPDAIDLSVVLPTFNESRNIAAVIQQLDAVLGNLSGISYEIIVV